MTKLIFTADDYGIVDAIDEGVRTSVEEGRINSVEVFPNDRQRVVESVRKLGEIDLKKYAEVQGIDKADAVINVGAHLSITSGYPLTDTEFFIRKKGKLKGAFRKWVDFERPKLSDRVREIRDLESELVEQIETLKTEVDKYPSLEFNHLTSHHNSLYYFDDYARTYYEIADHYGMAVRSPVGRPKIKDNLFYLQLNVRLVGDMNNDDLEQMWDFHKNIEDFLEKVDNRPTMTSFHNNVHYGPPPFAGLDRESMIRKARGKIRKMNKWLKKHKNDDSVEFVFHLIDWNPDELEAYERQADIKQTRYPGINPAYFDGRMAEFMSLQTLMNRNPSIAKQFTNWSNL